MATFKNRPSGTVEAEIRRKSLPGKGRVSLTFETMEKAIAYCREAEALIDSGTIPAELFKLAMEGGTPRRSSMQRTLSDLIRDYELEYAVNPDDSDRLHVIDKEIGKDKLKLDAITVKWATELIRSYKLTKRLKPATIRHRIGALRRCLDWASSVKGDLPINPLRLLPERYAAYNEAEAKVLAVQGEEAPDANNERDRRLEPGEEGRIRKVLANDPDYLKSVKAERGIRPESVAPMTLLFELAIETAMRLSEMFTLTIDQIDLAQRTVFLDKTKNGDKRQVPLSSVALRALTEYLAAHDMATGRLFPLFWDGDLSKRGRKKTTNKMSKRWRTIAALARCDDLHFHDLRHEATSRIYERTTFTDLQIAKITGHNDLKSLKRYANLRASSLAGGMW